MMLLADVTFRASSIWSMKIYPWTLRYVDQDAPATMLQQFKERLKISHMCKTFSNKHDLAANVATDLSRHLLRRDLMPVSPSAEVASEADKARGGEWSPDRWNAHRDGRKEANRDVYLVPSLSPSTIEGQVFDIFIYLKRQRRTSFDDVESAEFFLGKYWGSRLFSVPNAGQRIGISTSAYGEFLAVCRVKFKDGAEIFLERYVDFGEYSPVGAGGDAR